MKRWPWLLAAGCLLLVAASIFVGARNRPPVVLQKLFQDPMYQLTYQSVGTTGKPRGGWLYQQMSWYTTELSLWEVEQRLDGPLDRLGISRHFGSPDGIEWQTKNLAYHVRVYPTVLQAFPYVTGGKLNIEITEPHAYGLFERLVSLFRKPPTSSPPLPGTLASYRIAAKP